MSDNLDRALDNLQAQINREAEEKRKAEEDRRKAEEDRRKAEEERKEQKNKRIERFPIAVQENQLDEVKEMIAENIPAFSHYYMLEMHNDYHNYDEYFGIRLYPPSVEMAQLLIDDARKHKASEEFEKKFISKCIELHPEMAREWDKFAKDNKISYDFMTTDKRVFDKVVEQGFNVQCFDFERSVNIYYAAKNGYISEQDRDYGGTIYTWNKIDTIQAKKIKKDLIDVLNKGYKVDLSDKNTRSYAFMKELLMERELQDKSFVYRDNWEKFYDETTGQCRLTVKDLTDLGIYYGEKPVYHNRTEYDYNDVATGIIKEGTFSGYIGKKYYENGVEMTQKREALQRIAERKIQKEEKLEAKKLPEVIEKLGKAQIKFNSKIEAAFAVKKAQKEGRK